MRSLLRKLILWALDIKEQGSSAADLDKLAAELRK